MKNFIINMIVIFSFIMLLMLFNSYNFLSFLFGSIAELIIIRLGAKNVKS